MELERGQPQRIEIVSVTIDCELIGTVLDVQEDQNLLGNSPSGEEEMTTASGQQMRDHVEDQLLQTSSLDVEIVEPNSVESKIKARLNLNEARKRSMILLLMCLGQFMVILDVSIVNVALPAIKSDLGFTTNADLQWVVTAYAVAYGGLLLLGGR